MRIDPNLFSYVSLDECVCGAGDFTYKSAGP